MSEIYVPSTKARELSEALWSLASPPQVRRGSDITSALFGRVTDLQGNKWLVVPDDFGITVHPQAELNGIADILQPWIDNERLPAETNHDLANLIESKRGQWLVVYEAFPALFKLKDENNPTGLGRTREQLIEEALLTEPSMP